MASAAERADTATNTATAMAMATVMAPATERPRRTRAQRPRKTGTALPGCPAVPRTGRRSRRGVNVLPLVDSHVHLLAGLDDGPRDQDDALAMCRMAANDGTRLATALTHQNEHWPLVTPARIRAAAMQLSSLLAASGVELEVVPCAEVWF